MTKLKLFLLDLLRLAHKRFHSAGPLVRSEDYGKENAEDQDHGAEFTSQHGTAFFSDTFGAKILYDVVFFYSMRALHV